MLTRAGKIRMEQAIISETLVNLSEEQEVDCQKNELGKEKECLKEMMEDFANLVKKEMAKMSKEVERWRTERAKQEENIVQKIEEMRSELVQEIDLRFQKWEMKCDKSKQTKEDEIEANIRDSQSVKLGPEETKQDTEMEYKQNRMVENVKNEQDNHMANSGDHLDGRIEKTNGSDQLPQLNINQFLKIRTFEGKVGEAPVEHIRSLENYFRINKVNEISKLLVASAHLNGDALAWWESLFHHPPTFNQYKDMIVNNFWSPEHQETILYQIMQEKYKSNTNENYSQFFRRQAAKLRNLNACQTSEGQIIRIIRHNFPFRIEQTLLTANVNTMEHMAELLNVLDMNQLDKPPDKFRENSRISAIGWDSDDDDQRGYIKTKKKNWNSETNVKYIDSQVNDQGKKYGKGRGYRPDSPKPGGSKNK